jgi:acyl-CoA thioester hydrolase
MAGARIPKVCSRPAVAGAARENYRMQTRSPPATPPRSSFAIVRSIPTRWMDNDHYGHVNNVSYYSYFDTAVNGWLIEATGADIRTLRSIGIVAETSCRFLKELSFPDTVEAGLALERLGRSSVVYNIALFPEHEADAAALGRFVHVYVDAATRSVVPVPEEIRAVLATLPVAAGSRQ